MGHDGGLYRGDAPVSLPGIGGAPPKPYISRRADTNAVNSAASWVGDTPSRDDPPPGVVKPAWSKGGIAFAVVVLLILGAGLFISRFSDEVSSTVTAVKDTVSDALRGDDEAPGGTPDGDSVSLLPAGHTAALTYAGQPLEVTLLWAERQDSSWVDTDEADPELLVAVRLEQPDGVDVVTIPAWNWSIRTGGETVTGELSSFYEPSFASVTTLPGGKMAGLVAFDTERDDGVLEIRETSAGGALASWQLPPASEPLITVGELGEHTTAEIGRPGFSTKISDPRILAAADTAVPTASETGAYLVVDVEVWSVKDTDGYIGLVKAGNFVFRAADRTETVASTLESTLPPIVITSSDPPQSGTVAFDTAATSGEILLRDVAGRDVIRWEIALD